MKGGQVKRYKQFTRDTAQEIHHTCNGIVSLCRSLLRVSHNYVLLGTFSTDPLKREFRKLHQGSGGTYFIAVQQIIEKVNKSKASSLLSANVNVDSFNVEYGHSCFNCSFLLDKNSAEIFDGLPELESSVPKGTKMILVYIAGYDRGGLNVPTDNNCQWAIFCFILFNAVKEKVCRKSFCNLCMMVSEYYDFDMEKRHGVILSNILSKNLAKVTITNSAKEPALKMLKLS